MPKVKAKRAVKRANPQPPRLVRQTATSSGQQDHFDTLVGLTDPFSALAARAQYPDSGAGKSLSFQQRLSLVLSSDANGTAVFAFNPKVNFPVLAPSSTSGTTVTWAGTWSALGDISSNLVNTYGRSYRPTSYGIRVSNTLSATDSKGYIILAKGGIPPGLPSGTTFIPSNFASWDTHPYSHGGEWHVVGLPKSSNAYDMKELSTFNANTSIGDDTWQSIYLMVLGAPASASIGYVELFLNYEYVAREDAVIAQLSVPQPTLNIQMQTAINQVQSSHPNSHRGPQRVVADFIKREGKKALVKHVIPFVAKKATAALL